MTLSLAFSDHQRSPAAYPPDGDSGTITSASFTPADGDVLVVKACTWDTGTASGTPSGGGQSFTSQVVSAPGGFHGYVAIFTAVVAGSPGSMTVTLSAPAASSLHDMTVEHWTGAVLAATPATATGSGGSTAFSTTISTAAAGSVVSWASVDVPGSDPATRAYLSSAVETGLTDGFVRADGVFFHAYQAAASPGSQTVGMSNPATQQWNVAAIEIQAYVDPAPRPAVRAPSLAAIQASTW